MIGKSCDDFTGKQADNDEVHSIINKKGVVHDYTERKAVDKIAEISRLGEAFYFSMSKLHWSGRIE